MLRVLSTVFVVGMLAGSLRHRVPRLRAVATAMLVSGTAGVLYQWTAVLAGRPSYWFELFLIRSSFPGYEDGYSDALSLSDLYLAGAVVLCTALGLSALVR